MTSLSSVYLEATSVSETTLSPLAIKLTNPSSCVKILSADLVHNNFKYCEGLNVDRIHFNPTGSCRAGGLYFTTFGDFIDFLEYGTLIADVKVPEGIEVYADPMGKKWKAPQIIITNIREIKDLPEWNDVEFCRRALKRCVVSLKYIKPENYTHDGYESILLLAVNYYPNALMYIPEEKCTRNVYLAAVRYYGGALQFIPNEKRTPEILLAAVRQNGNTLYLIPPEQQTYEICLAAVTQYGKALYAVCCRIRDSPQSEEIRKAAII
jgi:hypothetical protein